jgi:hypothetical protein
MERNQVIVFAAVFSFVLLSSAWVSAQNGPGGQEQGTYQVTFQEISNSCTDVGLELKQSALTVTRRGMTVEVSAPEIPAMTGKARKGGKFRVAVQKSRTSISGVQGSFSAAGQVDNKSVQLVLVAEYFRGDKALCTQSWDVSGARR